MFILIRKIFAQQIFWTFCQRKLPDLFMTFDNNKFININMNINTTSIDISLEKIHAAINSNVTLSTHPQEMRDIHSLYSLLHLLPCLLVGCSRSWNHKPIMDEAYERVYELCLLLLVFLFMQSANLYKPRLSLIKRFTRENFREFLIGKIPENASFSMGNFMDFARTWGWIFHLPLALKKKKLFRNRWRFTV